MAIAVLFSPVSMNATQYDECIKQLEQAGAGRPSGRLHHVCYGDTDNLHVFDVFDSMESFEKFGQTLMPILQAIGIDAGPPVIQEIHNTIKG